MHVLLCIIITVIIIKINIVHIQCFISCDIAVTVEISFDVMIISDVYIVQGECVTV